MDQRRINALPLNGRNYAQLALLGAGVSPAEPGSRMETSSGFSANGARSLQNNFLLDGIDNNANLGDVLNGSSYVVQPSVDAIAEFKVETNAYSAEFGRGNGAIMNAVIKSGTNQFHGDVFEFLRNEKFDALNRFDTAQQPYKQNQFGFTFGGPIVKNKTFFFGDYEGYRLRHALPQLAQVPSGKEAGGDFSAAPDEQLHGQHGAGAGSSGLRRQCDLLWRDLRCPAGRNLTRGVPIGGYASAVIRPTGQPISFHRISGILSLDNSSINLVATAISQHQITSRLTVETIFNPIPSRARRSDRFDIRVDQTLSQNDNFFARFSFGNST